MTIDIDALGSKITSLSEQVKGLLALSDMSQLRIGYQRWYSQVKYIVNAYLPKRLKELERFYDFISRYLTNPSHLDYAGKGSRMQFQTALEQQQGILLSVPHVIELRVFEVTVLVTADLVQGELHQAGLLLEHGFIRASGAVAGVALESHLKLLHSKSGLTYTDKDSIVPLASRLRQNSFISLGDEKKCIAMADTRNKCDHKKPNDPTMDEVAEQ